MNKFAWVITIGTRNCVPYCPMSPISVSLISEVYCSNHKWSARTSRQTITYFCRIFLFERMNAIRNEKRKLSVDGTVSGEGFSSRVFPNIRNITFNTVSSMATAPSDPIPPLTCIPAVHQSASSQSVSGQSRTLYIFFAGQSALCSCGPTTYYSRCLGDLETIRVALVTLRRLSDT